MSYVSKVEQIYANEILLTSKTGTNVDIRCNTGDVLINGADPSGGGASLPLIGQGNIEIDGLFESTGNITTTAGNIVASTGNVQLGSGNIELTNGDVNVNGNGNVKVIGSGDIKVLGTGGITSVGDIETSTGDIVSAGNFIFEGNDIQHRTNNPSTITSYVQYKQLPQLNANNNFTGANKFDDNVNEFSQKVSVGTRDAQGLFTQKTAINPSGNIECVSLNNGTAITTGTINCGNGGTNSCAAKTFTTRTSGLAGWTLEQQTVQGDALDNVLQMKGGQAGAYISIIDSAFSGFVPNITLDPRTTALGGQVQTDLFTVGDGANAFNITQPKSGADSNNLLIQAGAANTPIKFQNNAGTTDLVRIEPDGTDGSGRIYCPAIFFGTTGLHNSIVNDIAGPESLVMKIRQATASSEVIFLDNDDAELIRIQKTQVELKDDIPLLFGNYSFRPQQFYKDITNFSFNNSAIGATNLLFNTGAVGGNPVPTDWTNRNTGQTGQSIDLINNPGAYKITIRQLAGGTLNEINGLHIMSDMVLSRPNDNAPDVELAQPTAYSFERYDGTSPVITMLPGFLNWAVHITFPQVSNNETANIRITMTQMPYF